MRNISAAVGQGATNLKVDVTTVQEMLNKVPPGEGGPQVPLKVDGLAWNKTDAAIKRFQHINLGHKWPDGRVDPHGKTFTRLNDYDEQQPEPAPAKNLVYYVPGKKVVIGQPTLRTCWATVYTMMRSWREGKKFAIEEALEKPGKQYVDLYTHDLLLPATMMRDFWTRGGLTMRGNAYFADYIWYDFLKQHGLVVVGSANSMPPAPGLHLRILEGINITGSANDCYYIIDPAWGGKQYPEASFNFESKYNLAMTVGPGAHWQVAHYY
jgi:Papain-like cysteine protease AvrRpt2